MFRLPANRLCSGRDCWKLLLAICIATYGNLMQAQVSPSHVDDFTGRPRVIVLSDIGNEPDDQMSFVRLLLYSNELDLEALIASTSTWQKNAVHPETMHLLIHAYGQVQRNLLLHASGWPTAEQLDSHVFAGQSAYGMAATGPRQGIRRGEGDHTGCGSARPATRVDYAFGEAQTRWHRRFSKFAKHAHPTK